MMLIGWRVRQVAQEVRRGGVIAYPTEAVWGLGCDPWNPMAVQRLLDLKQRPVSKGLILVAESIDQFDFVLEGLPRVWLDTLAESWPGPNTWLVPHRQRLPSWITGQHDSVALRVTAHPLVRELCALCGPLVSTSANPTGYPSARSRLRVEQYFSGQLDSVLGGYLGGRRHPSVIRDLQTGELIRSS